MSEHDHPHSGPPDHPSARPVAPASPMPSPQDRPFVEDAGSQALSAALRSSFTIVKVIMVLLIFLFFASGVFTVGPQERAVILRFGKARGAGAEQLLGPGLHWAWPYPIDAVEKIPIGQIQTVRSTAGWYAVSPEMEAAGEQPEALPSLNPAREGYTLTADGNIIHVRASLRYRITDPLSYTFSFVAASNVVQNALDNALFYASARFKVDRILRDDVAAFKETIRARVSQLIVSQNLGIVLDPADVEAVAPVYVRPAFNEVLAAEQDKNKSVNAARGYENALLSRAQGEANAIINQGQADRSSLVKAAAAEARYLNDRVPEYRRDPHSFQQRLLTETWMRILTNATDKFIMLERGNGGQSELRLLLSREPQKAGQTNQP